MWTARVRRPDLTLDEPIEFDSAELVENYNNMPDMLSLTGDIRRGRLASAAQPGWGVYLTDQAGGWRFSGPLIKPFRQGNGRMDLVFASDLVHLRDRFCWPVPANPWTTAGQNQSHDTRTGPSETRLLQYIDVNAGPGARAERQVAGLAVPASQGRGPDARSRARFQNLNDLVATLAEQAGLRIVIEQEFDPTTQAPILQVKLVPAPDLTAWAKFGSTGSGGPGVLDSEWSYSLEPPSAVVVLAAAGGQMTNRLLMGQEGNGAESALWGRRTEFFADRRDTTDPVDVQGTLDESLEEGVGAKEISAPLGDTFNLQIGTDIPVGSVIQLDLDGYLVDERIRQVTTRIDGETGKVEVKPLVGTPDVGLVSPEQRKLATLLKKVANLERRY